MKIFIIGAGEVGFNLAQKLSEEGQHIVLVDKDPEKIKRIEENLDVQVFLGSGTSPGLLKDAGIKGFDMMVAATDSDEVNIISCLLARNLNPTLIKVARIRNQELANEKEIFRKDLLGVDHIINPESAMVGSILALMEVPGTSEVIDFVEGRVKLIGLMVHKRSPLCGRKLLSLTGIKEKLLIGAIVRGERVIIPRGNNTIEPGDLVYIVARDEDLEDVLELFDVTDESLRRVVIVGAGQMGEALATALDKTGVNAKIIDKDPDRCEELAESLDKVIVIKGDGTDKALLLEENISGVDFVVAITGDEESNVFISLLAKQLGAKRTITRISKLSYLPLVSAIGIDTVVSPRLATIRIILQRIRRGKVISVAPLQGEQAEALEAEALETSDIVGKPLSKIKFPRGAIVAVIIRGERIIIPRGDSIIMAQDRLIIFALKEVLPGLEKLLTVKLEYF